jgi:hypothetical protein
VFWTRPSREARRQKVLDELLELSPDERPARLEGAVAAGDIRADEVHAVLALVKRLDALSVMTPYPVSGTPGGVAPEATAGLPVSQRTTTAKRPTARKPTARKPAARAVAATPAQKPAAAKPKTARKSVAPAAATPAEEPSTAKPAAARKSATSAAATPAQKPAAAKTKTARKSATSAAATPAQEPAAAKPKTARKSATSAAATPAQEPAAAKPKTARKSAHAVAATRAQEPAAAKPKTARKSVAPAAASKPRKSVGAQLPAPESATNRVPRDSKRRPAPKAPPVPVELAAAVSHVVETDLANPRARAGSWSSRKRRHRVVAEDRASTRGRAKSDAKEALDEHAPDGTAPSWPDISWLRH